jgi:hypothetical protein
MAEEERYYSFDQVDDPIHLRAAMSTMTHAVVEGIQVILTIDQKDRNTQTDRNP